jgi:uncharacterized protein
LKQPLTLWLLGDGKPGHENQTLGLADAIARQHSCTIHRISVAGQRGIFQRVRAASEASAGLPPPDLIIGAGHATHLALWWLARKHRAKSVVLMKPSLPLGAFDLCLVPAHDFQIPPQRENLILTQGALNRVTPPTVAARSGGLILIGGPSATHGWDGKALLTALQEISASGDWQLTNSRRTPVGFIQELKNQLPGIEILPHQETRPEWLPAQLAKAADVWVTEDSVSMIYEALSSGARVGLLEMPRTRTDSRVLRGLDALVSQRFLSVFTEWRVNGKLSPPPAILREADRCASEVISRWRAK